MVAKVFARQLCYFSNRLRRKQSSCCKINGYPSLQPVEEVMFTLSYRIMPLATFVRCEIRLDNVGSGAKGDWDFRISDLVKNPDGTDI